ncbi:MAG: chromate transporter [Clostridia bacterium]|nr:chromate transporter [Clostridia bacterium]
MIYLELFLTFFKIGLFTFGGGYAMIPLISDAVVKSNWLTSEEFLNFVAVCESTPGPIAINMATFVGSSQGGILGSICATSGVVLPSFFIILAILVILKKFLKYKGVQGFLAGVRPCVVGLIVATAIIIGMSTLMSVSSIGDKIIFQWKEIVIFLLIAIIGFIYKKIRDKKISPILLICISAIFGIIFNVAF